MSKKQTDEKTAGEAASSDVARARALTECSVGGRDYACSALVVATPAEIADGVKSGVLDDSPAAVEAATAATS